MELRKAVGIVQDAFEEMGVGSFPEVQEFSSGTLLAAYHVMAEAELKLTRKNLMEVLNAFISYASDEEQVALGEDGSFLGLCVKRGFSSGLMQQITKEVAAQILDDFRRGGCHVVRLRETRGWDPADCGFYVFGSVTV